MSCNELRNIEYQTMLLSNNHSNKDKGVLNIKQESNQKMDIDNMLTNEKNTSLKNKPWSKLEKIYKIQKLNEYAEQFGKKHELNDEKIQQLKNYLLMCLNRKRLLRVKELTYDKNECKIKEIIGLQMNNDKKFTLKNPEKKTSTLKNLTRPKQSIKKRMKSKKTQDKEE